MVRMSSHSKRKGIQSGNQFVSIAIPTHFYHYWQTAFIVPSLSEEALMRRWEREDIVGPHTERSLSATMTASQTVPVPPSFLQVLLPFRRIVQYHFVIQIDGLFLTRLQLIFLNLHKIFLILWRSYISGCLIANILHHQLRDDIDETHPQNQEYNDLLTLSCLQKSRYLRHVLLQDEHQLRNVDSPVGLIAGG